MNPGKTLLLTGMIGGLLSGVPSGADVIALYEFNSGRGDQVVDRSGLEPPLNLRITQPERVRWVSDGLELKAATIVRSDGPAGKINRAVARTGELTVEAWIKPADTDQKGPARIVTISKNSSFRNATLGQEGRRYDFRLRARRTSDNGIPSVDSPGGEVAVKWTQVLYARDRHGNATLYVDGRPVGWGPVVGDLQGWAEGYQLALGNELTVDRPWRGVFRRVVIHDRALPPEEVRRSFGSGPLGAGGLVAESRSHPGVRLFEARIAPLFAEHCLECHDTATRKGDLDLSRRKGALSEGFIVPGRATESAVWQSMLDDDMPRKRTPLTAQEKALLKRWIDDGAHWGVELIEPALYGRRSGGEELFVRRLTVSEYVATVKATTGVELTEAIRQRLPPDLRADGFSNTAYNLNVDLEHVAAYARLAAWITEQMDVAAFCRQFGRSRKLVDKDNRAMISAIGSRLFRGPLEEHELATYRGIATTAASASVGFDVAMGLVIEAMLQSPRFLYRMERPLPGARARPYELASRLSYLLWGAPPDDELYRAAEQGRLMDDEEVAGQVDRMLKDHRAMAQSRRFVAEWLNLDRLKHLRPAPSRFPAWNPELASEMRDETLLFFEEVAWRRPMAELLNARVTYLGPRLARHYGMQPVDATGVRVKTAHDAPRGGLLTQGSLLTIGGDEASMVARGLFVLKDLLRGSVKDPPPCVSVTPVPTRSGLTQRGIAEERIANASCGGCHVKFEPLAFGLERYDGVGGYHERDEHGNPLREDGAVLFPGSAQPRSYRSARELFDLLASSPRVAECLTWKVAQFALGRPLSSREASEMEKIHACAIASGGRYPDVIRAIALSDLVRRHQESAPEELTAGRE